MNATRSCVVRPLQLRMKSAPASGRASFEPRRSGMWQPAQFATYDERPAAACCSVYGPPCAPAASGVNTATTTSRNEARIRNSSRCDPCVFAGSRQKPTPEVTVGRRGAMDLQIKPALLQARELRRRELELCVERAARRLRHREFRHDRAAHAEHRTLVQCGDGRGADETGERARHG